MLLCAAVYMTMLGTFGKKLKDDLQQYPPRNADPGNPWVQVGIGLRQQFKKRKRKQESTAECQQHGIGSFSCPPKNEQPQKTQ